MTDTSTPSSKHASQASIQRKKVHFPVQNEVFGKVRGHEVQQLYSNSFSGDFIVVPYQVERTKGFLFEDSNGRKIFVASKATPPPSGTAECLKVKAGTLIENIIDFSADNLASKWTSPSQLDPEALSLDASDAHVKKTRESWAGKVSLIEEVRSGEEIAVRGLRPPQIGAIYATLAHWKISSEPATIVMPTGTGKTDTMLALLLRERLERLMIVVPTDALRDQLAKKFLTLGFFKEFGLIGKDTKFPIVGILHSRPKTTDEVDEVFRRCNVIVTTMSVAGVVDVAIQKRMAHHCSHLFIDEAHHVSAETWDDFKNAFLSRHILQFTATPFRNDGKHVAGKMIFNYPLAKAQKEGYFRPIIFRPVSQFNPDRADTEIANKAIQQLKEDLKKGFDHIAMARAGTIVRAKALVSLYQEMAPQFSPILVHSQLKTGERKAAFEAMNSRESRVVVCVDMLGEGFDFPELKIAAIHDLHKSLAITLQFTGRFTRFKPSLGEATMVANIADPRVEDSLTELYAEDADWNLLLQGLSDGATRQQTQRTEFLKNFTEIPEKVPLQNIYPKMSTLVFRTRCSNWMPKNLRIPSKGISIYAGPTINYRDRVMLFISKEPESVPWGAVRDLQNTSWHLYLIHWNKDLGMLFINTSNHDESHDEIVASVTGASADLVQGEIIFRALHGFSRLVLMNLGLRHSISRAVRFSMHAGSDITPELADAHTQNKIKTNLFGKGYENGARATIGCSKKGRIWSHKIAYDISEWVRWCATVGQKLNNNSLSTSQILKNTLQPKPVKSRPNLVPLVIEWPDAFYERDEDAILFDFGDGELVSLLDVELRLADNSSEGPIKFFVVGPKKSIEYEVMLSEQEATYGPTRNASVEVSIRGKKLSLSEVFQKENPPIYFEDGSFLLFNELYELPSSANRAVFDREKITILDWNGIDLKKESQTVKKLKDSIQRRMIDTLLALEAPHSFQIIMDDDDSGEAADIVAISVAGEKLIVHFYHCKFSKEDTAGARVDDLYAVCGQAQRSIHWRSDVESLMRHLLKRDENRKSKTGVSRFERGDAKTLTAIMRQSRVLLPEFKIFVVQPGLSKHQANNKQLELLSATELYLKETYGIAFGVVANS